MTSRRNLSVEGVVPAEAQTGAQRQGGFASGGSGIR